MQDRVIAKVVKKGSQFCVVSKDGNKNLGCYDTEQEAKKRLQQVEFFKHSKGIEMDNFNNESLREALSSYAQDRPKMTKPKEIKKPESLSEDPAGDRSKGSIGGVECVNVIDGKDHFPINNENQARSAVNRVLIIRSTPDWFQGTVADLRNAVKAAVAEKYPSLSVSVQIQFDKAISTVNEIKDPSRVNEKKVPQIPTPNIEKTMKDKEAAKAEIIDFVLAGEENLEAFASNLEEKIQNKINKLGDAKQLAARLTKDGLSGEEFSMLIDFLQEDILHELMMKSSTNAYSKKEDLLKKMRKKNDG